MAINDIYSKHLTKDTLAIYHKLTNGQKILGGPPPPVLTKLCKLFYDDFYHYSHHCNDFNLHSPKESVSLNINEDLDNKHDFMLVPPIICAIIKSELTKKFTITYTYINTNTVNIYFYVSPNISLKTIKNWTHKIIIWLNFLYDYNKSNGNKCNNTLALYLFLTSHKKELPTSKQSNILDELNVNTGYTSTCIKNNTIVIYRQEEWFKVFIHETLHSFGIDFSALSPTMLSHYSRNIIELFGVKLKHINLFEAYTELWAEIINIFFNELFYSSQKITLQQFVKNSWGKIQYEMYFNVLQINTINNYMNIGLNDFKSPHISKTTSRNYKEKTNILCYYYIKNILLFNLAEYLNTMHSTVLQTQHTTFINYIKFNIKTLPKFCKFIREHYLQTFLKIMEISSNTIINLKWKSLRMTLFDYL